VGKIAREVHGMLASAAPYLENERRVSERFLQDAEYRIFIVFTRLAERFFHLEL
jgi:hypothetical protein